MASLCASFHDVPLELDSGSSSSGMIRVSTTTSSSGDDVKGQRLGRGEHRPAFSSRLHPPTLSLASSALLHPPSLTSVALTSLNQVIRVPPPVVAAAVIAAAAAVAAAATVATVATRPPDTAIRNLGTACDRYLPGSIRIYYNTIGGPHGV